MTYPSGPRGPYYRNSYFIAVVVLIVVLVLVVWGFSG